MKVRDLPPSKDLIGIKVKIPKKYQDDYSGILDEMYVASFWGSGIWFKKYINDNLRCPLCIDPKLLLDFTVIGE